MDEEADYSPQRFLYQANFEESARVYHRTDWFLVFHAIMLEAFFAAFDRATPLRFAPAVVALLGLLTAYLWFMSGLRQRWILWHLGEAMSDSRLMPGLSDFHRQLYKTRAKYLPPQIAWAGTVGAFGVVIPAAVVIVWFALVVWTAQALWLSIPLSVGLLGVATVATKRLGRGPTVPAAALEDLLLVRTPPSQPRDA